MLLSKVLARDSCAAESPSSAWRLVSATSLDVILRSAVEGSWPEAAQMRKNTTGPAKEMWVRIGLVLLIDARFSEVRYRRLFPAWWKCMRVRHSDGLQQAVDHFWQPFSI